MSDDPNLFQQVAEYINLSRSALGLFKEAHAALPKGEKRDELEQRIGAAEASLKRSDAALAKQLGYKLCQCTFPPQIMLWKEQQKSWACPNPDCGRTVEDRSGRAPPSPSGPQNWMV
jgi:hypothetical protein